MGSLQLTAQKLYGLSCSCTGNAKCNIQVTNIGKVCTKAIKQTNKYII
jgi:hypothetical protein